MKQYNLLYILEEIPDFVYIHYTYDDSNCSQMLSVSHVLAQVLHSRNSLGIGRLS